MPILPTVLINGAEGIGTGWSTFIPNYNPRDIVENLKRLIQGQELVPMQPWYRGFTGSIEEVPTKTGGRSYVCNGTIKQVCALVRASFGGVACTMDKERVQFWANLICEPPAQMLTQRAGQNQWAGQHLRQQCMGGAGGWTGCLSDVMSDMHCACFSLPSAAGWQLLAATSRHC